MKMKIESVTRDGGMKFWLRNICLVAGLCLVTSCTTKKVELPVEPVEYIEARVPNEPEGIVRYCWEEPIAVYQEQGPGLDPDGTWYHPSYTAVRKARQGRWRPCQEVVSEREQRD